MIDSYAYIQYVNLGLTESWTPTRTGLALEELLHQKEAFAQIAEMAQRADYIVVDARAVVELTRARAELLVRGRPMIYRKDNVAIFGERQ